MSILIMDADFVHCSRRLGQGGAVRRLFRLAMAVTAAVGLLHLPKCFAGQAELAPLRAAINQEIQKSGIQVGVVVKHLESGQELLVNDDTLYPMASTYKIPIMVEVYRQIRAGRLSLGDRVEMTEFDRN